MTVKERPRVLHVTNWYPNADNPAEGIFVEEQVRLFSQATDTRLICVQVRDGSHLLRIEQEERDTGERILFVRTRISIWRIREWIGTLALVWVLISERVWRYDLLHVHIAYPLLAQYGIWGRFLRVPLLISEHWSAYHRHFQRPQGDPKLDRIRRIFRRPIHVAVVSKALERDIRNFSGSSSFHSHVLSNVMDMDTFAQVVPRQSDPEAPLALFMINIWRKIKNPFPLFEALAAWKAEGGRFTLRLGGYGPLVEDMKAAIAALGLNDEVVFLGRLKKVEIAQELGRADFYLYSSNYETFSVACAQALIAGVPLMGPPLDAVGEYAGEHEKLEVAENSALIWQAALRRASHTVFDRPAIAMRMQARFAHAQILDDYMRVVAAARAQGFVA